jgi:putative transcriptional regulator
MARMTLDEIKASKPKVDHEKLDATTEEDIRRYMIEDGYDPDEEPTGYEVVVPAQMVRKQLGMTQEEFAAALRIPVATLQNWEQGRVRPDPAARSLLLIVHRNPKAALKALAA